MPTRASAVYRRRNLDARARGVQTTLMQSVYRSHNGDTRTGDVEAYGRHYFIVRALLRHYVSWSCTDVIMSAQEAALIEDAL